MRWAQTACPTTEVLLLTAHDRNCYLAWMVEAGAAGYLTKDQASAALVEAIRRAARGEVYYSPEQRERASRWQKEVGKWLERLTKREWEVLRLLAEGKDNKAIAQRLGVTTKTVAYHVANVLNKLGVCSRLEAVAWVHENLPDDLVKIPG